MEETQQQAANHGAALDDLVALVEKAAQTIAELRTRNTALAEQAERAQAEAASSTAQLQSHLERIAELENMVRLLQPAADRHLRMKAQLEARPESQGGFTANGMTYKTFDEAFDVAYPASSATQAGQVGQVGQAGQAAQATQAASATQATPAALPENPSPDALSGSGPGT